MLEKQFTLLLMFNFQINKTNNFSYRDYSMNIFSAASAYSFSHYAVSLLKDQVLPALTAQQRKILVVVSVAFSCLAALYLTYRCCFRATSLTNEDEQALLNHPLFL